MFIAFAIALLWVLLYVIDNIFESRVGFRYISWKFQHDILLKPFYISWQNSRIGIKTFYDWNFRLSSKKYLHWFNCGVVVAFIVSIYGYCLLVPPVFKFFGNYLDRHFYEEEIDDKRSIHSTSLVLGLPGYNIPWSHVIEFFSKSKFFNFYNFLNFPKN